MQVTGILILFQKNVLFPFGYGLSYTTFEITETGTQKKKDGIKVVVRVKNTGAVPGKEVAQVYWSKMDQEGCEHPMQALGGFEKTSQLAPGEEEVLSITIPWKELAVYEEERAAWVLEKGSMHCVWETLPEIRSVENLCKQNRIMFWSNVRIA